jgi:hypothetical protein
MPATERRRLKKPFQPSIARLKAMRERSGWALQPARLEEDSELLREWIAADPDHAGRTTAAGWLHPAAGVENLLLVDREGPLLFLRCANAMRLDIQFSPGNRMRMAGALLSGLPWLAEQARDRGYAQMIYESRSPRLVKFLERIGFREVRTEHVLQL